MARAVQLLDASGQRREHPEFSFRHGDDTIRSWYRDLMLVRRVDVEATALQRHGELGLWAPCLGQEAAQIGSAHALSANDFAFPSYREHGVAWCRGVPPSKLLGLFRGTELGGWDPAEYRLALPAIVIGAQTLHAAGYGMGLVFEDNIGHEDHQRDAGVITYFGDGATSQGDVHEAMVFAASFTAPVVFFCQNNHWAISVPAARQTKNPIVQRATGYGMPGIRVDGNDILACYAVTEHAMGTARSGGGPSLIEAVTYRMGAHTTSDDPSRYRDAHELDDWRTRDPIARVRAYLESVGTDPAFFTAIDAEADDLGADLRAQCKALDEPDFAALFLHVNTALGSELARQRAEYQEWQEGAA